jgi:hypothetical protein
VADDLKFVQLLVSSGGGGPPPTTTLHPTIHDVVICSGLLSASHSVSLGPQQITAFFCYLQRSFTISEIRKPTAITDR